MGSFAAMTPRGKRVLIGCGIGCGAVLLIVVGSAIAFTIWIRQPGPPLELESLLADDTIGYLEWRLRKEDPATESFLRALIERTSQIPAQAEAPLPTWILDGISQYQVRRNEAALDQLLPLAAAWTLRSGVETGREEQVFLLSLRNIGNRMRFVDWILGFTIGADNESASTHEHAGETIYRFTGERGQDVTLFIREGSVYFTSDLEAALGLVDRLITGAEGGRGTESLARLLASIPAEKSLRAAVTGGSGAIPRILGRIAGPGHPPEPSWDRFQSMTLSGGFTEDRGFAARVELSYSGDPAPARSGEELAGLISSVLERWNLTVETSATVDPGRIGIDVLFPDLLDMGVLPPASQPANQNE